MNKRITTKESEEPAEKRVPASKKTNTEISNSFLQRIISLLKKEELI
ncbi:hypothetical protein SAMN05421664_2819 [Chryseobacterium soldanellicola]|uniref:Uncharacterized protein n=1 Tax=Chryseobacterium soldanellicola TaxID=311333 RepID=A0A1H1E7R9_9FLAO|nr:hypothetical protein [Chryseobacterium soldanellicola]SDQ84568.1 hypothetical protein SAMN05421664_2819 [Chryseobacterium soldanellicola]